MSDAPQQPDWWQASDGKWYPPDQHPSRRSLPPPPTAATSPVIAPPQEAWWKQPRSQIAAAIVAVIVVLGIIGAINDRSDEPSVTDTTATVATSATTAGADTAVRATPTSPPAPTAGPANLGTRTNPYPLGEPFAFTIDAIGDADESTWEVRVAGPATDLSGDVNQFWGETDEFTAYVGVPIELTLTGASKEPLSTQWNFEFALVGKSSLTVADIPMFDLACSSDIAGVFDDDQQVFIGGTLSGVLCVEVRSVDLEAGWMLTVDGARGEPAFLDVPTTTRSEPIDSTASPDITLSTSEPTSTETEGSPDEGTGSWTYNSRWSDQTWTGDVIGYTFVDTSDDDVDCLAIIGTATPQTVAADGLSIGTPPVSLVADGAVLSSSWCGGSELRAAGYETLWFESFAAGVEFPFFEAYEVSSPPETVEVVIGDTDSADTYERVLIRELPSIPEATYVGAALPADGLTPADTTIEVDDGDQQWSVEVTGLFARLDADQACLTIFGYMTPTDLDGELAAGSLDSPTVALVIDGRVRTADRYSSYECEADAAEAAGYGELADAEVVEGARYPFYATVEGVAADAAAVQAVVVDGGLFAARTVAQIVLLDAIPAAG